MEWLNSAITASSTLTGVLITLILTNKREKRRFLHELKYKEYKDKERFYIELIAIIDRQVERIKFGDFEIQKDEAASLTLAGVSIYGTQEIVDKFREVQILISEWHTIHEMASPKRLADTSLAIVSTTNLENIKPSKEAYDKYFDKAVELVGAIKSELERQKKAITS